MEFDKGTDSKTADLTQQRASIEALGAAVMAARHDDEASLLVLTAAITAVKESEEIQTDAARSKQLTEWLVTVGALREGQVGDGLGALKRLRGQVAELQDAFEAGDSGVREAEADGRFVLPEWVDDSVFADFLASSESTIEKIESDILLLEESFSAEILQSLKRKIHTLKGEAGVLGLRAVETVCHTLEEYLEAASFSSELLLTVKDWLAASLSCYSRGELPSDDEVIPLLADALSPDARVEHSDVLDAASQKASKHGADADPPSPQAINCETGDATGLGNGAWFEEPPVSAESPLEEERVTASSSAAEEPEVQDTDLWSWDEDAVEIVGEFMQETDEGLTQVDDILLAAEREVLDSEKINALFRVFHSIKGVAGFLDLDEVTELAHITETMLDQGRTGKLGIEGAVLDLVFDSTEMMRAMLGGLREAVNKGCRPAPDPNMPKLVTRLQAVVSGTVPVAEPLPEAAPGEPLGAIVAKPPLSVDRKAVGESLAAQQETGRRLGQELVARGAARPKQVSQALRAQSRASNSNKTLKEVVKVDLDRVDSLVSLIGELVIVESMVVNAPELKAQASPWLRKHLGQMSKITRDLQDIGTRMRMVPVRGVFQKMARMVRDLSHRNGKAVVARMEGESTEMDRSMVEQIGDPLVHMIRNAVDHGIEDQASREAAGKSSRGLIDLRAFHRGGSVVIEVRDDGRGLNRDRILTKAQEKGLIDMGAKLTDSEIYNLIFAPGFSTAAQVTEISGRGVGMDVVRRNIEAIRGRVTIDSVPGEGSTFTMTLPLTLAIINGMLIACGQERYIIPTLSVIESLRPDAAMIRTVTGRAELVSLRGESFPLFRLGRLLKIDDAKTEPTDALVVIVESRGKKMGILVDDVITQQQVVIKSLDDSLPGTRYLSGAAIMSDGRVGLILNTDEIGVLIDNDAIQPVARPAEEGSGRGDAGVAKEVPVSLSRETISTLSNEEISV